MVNPAIQHLPRADRKMLMRNERRVRESGDWGRWEYAKLPNGTGGSGWNEEVRGAFRNKVFCVLVRPIGGVTHLAVASLSGTRPTWREMQRIKDELVGEDKTAIEVYPPKAEIVDDADMFHIWVVARLPFSLKDSRHMSDLDEMEGA